MTQRQMPCCHQEGLIGILRSGKGEFDGATAAECFKKGCVEVVKRGGRFDDCKVVSIYLCRAAAGQPRDRAVYGARAESALEFGWALRRRTAEGAADWVDGPAGATRNA